VCSKRLHRLLTKTKENLVASVVDVASLFVAYHLGVEQLGPLAGIGYGFFDAWIVIWQRERISSALHKSAHSIKTSKIFAKKARAPPLPWMARAQETASSS
jgi:hypothetical protein